MHNTHRAASVLLAEAAAKPAVPAAALAELRDFLVPNLEHHHRMEDDVLWPLIEKAAPDVAAAFAELTKEHAQLDAILQELGDLEIAESVGRGPLLEKAVALRDIVHRHMANEEPHLLPALTNHVADETWDLFAKQVKESTPLINLHLLIGLIDMVGSEEEIQLMLRDLPVPALQQMRQQAGQTFAALDAA